MSLTFAKRGCLRRPFQSATFLVTVVYVATDLHVLVIPGRQAITIAHDLRQQDDDNKTRSYRRLTLRYWVWLRAQMQRAEAMAAEGRITPTAIQAARQRMAFCDAWIEESFNAQQIATALSSSVQGYQAPLRVRAA